MKKIMIYDDYNSKMPTKDKQDVIGAVTQTFGHTALRNGWKIIEIDGQTEDSIQDDA